MKKMSHRRRFINTATLADVAAHSWAAMDLACHHDPEHEKDIKQLRDELDIVKRQLERIGAPQYRKVRKGIYAEIVRGPRSAKALKD